MLNFIRVVWAILMAFYYYVFIKDYKQVKTANELDEVSVAKVGIVGFITNFFDTLGIGSFAPTVAFNKFLKMGVRDKDLPGLLNVGDTLPVMCEAVIFTTYNIGYHVSCISSWFLARSWYNFKIR